MSLREEENSVQQKLETRVPIEIRSLDGQLTLRQYTLGDAKEIFDLIDQSRDHLSQNGEDTADKYKSLILVVNSIKRPSNPNRLRFAIRNENGKFVGGINLTLDEQDPERAEIGYWLGKKFTGKGYVGRAVEVLTRYGFKRLGCREIFGVVAETNTPSLNVLKRYGYAETGRKTEEKDGQLIPKIVLTRFRSSH